MKPTVTARVARDTSLVIGGLFLLVAALLWGAWLVDFGLRPRQLMRPIAVIVLAGFVLLLSLLVVLVVSERSNHYAGEPTSRLHLPLMVSTGALAVYFGIASINAADVFYRPGQQWPLLRDPTIQLITTALILVIVAAKAWLLWEILPRRPWDRRKSPRKTPPRRSR